MGLLTPQVAVCHVLKCADTVAAAAAAAFMAWLDTAVGRRCAAHYQSSRPRGGLQVGEYLPPIWY